MDLQKISLDFIKVCLNAKTATSFHIIICRLFHILAQFLFTASEREL